MKFESFVALLMVMAIVGITAGAANFDLAEKRAVECCKNIGGPIPIDCSFGVVNGNMKMGCKLKRVMGLVSPSGIISKQKEKLEAIVKEAQPLVITSTACITKWQDHTECCRTANLPDDCLYLCDYHKVKHYNEEQNEQSIVDMCGQCHPYMEIINKCTYAD